MTITERPIKVETDISVDGRLAAVRIADMTEPTTDRSRSVTNPRVSRVSAATLLIVVAILAVLVVPRAAHLGNPVQGGTPQPTASLAPAQTIDKLRFWIEGTVQYGTASFIDYYGTENSAAVGEDIEVENLTLAILAVVGENVTCHIDFDGETVASAISTSGDSITLCMYRPMNVHR